MKHELAMLLETLYPGAIKSWVNIGGEMIEVSVPTTEEGLPVAREILRGDRESVKGAVFDATSIDDSKKAVPIGNFAFPIIVMGKVREITGLLMVTSAGRFIFSTDRSITVGTGKNQETRYIPLWRVSQDELLYSMEVAKDRDLKAIMGAIIAHEYNLRFKK